MILIVKNNHRNAPCFWLILRYAHGLYDKVLSRSRALSYSKNTTGNLFTTENAEISDDFWKRRTQLYFSYYKRAFYIKAQKYRRFGNVRIINCWHKHACYDFGREKGVKCE